MDTRVKGDTHIFASIGDPVKYSLSPQIHNSIFSLNHLNNIHLTFKIAEGDLENYIHIIRNNFSGISVTKPHKQSIIPYLDQIDEDAAKFQAVNAVKIENGLLKGYNTDGYGFVKSLELHNIDIDGKKILLIGAGGASRVLAFEILRLGGKLTITNRSLKNALKLKDDLLQYFNQEQVTICEMDDLTCGYFGIVNATPIGMAPDIGNAPIEEPILKGSNFVFDLIYNPERTLLLDYAKKEGCKCINGFSMLFYQAIKAQEIWTGKITDKAALLKVKEEIEEYLRNDAVTAK